MTKSAGRRRGNPGIPYVQSVMALEHLGTVDAAPLHQTRARSATALDRSDLRAVGTCAEAGSQSAATGVRHLSLVPAGIHGSMQKGTRSVV